MVAVSYQGSAWYKHSRHFLDGIDPHLGKMFEEAMRRAGLPQVSEATAFEAILADFLSGPGDTLYAASMLPHIMRHLKPIHDCPLCTTVRWMLEPSPVTEPPPEVA